MLLQVFPTARLSAGFYIGGLIRAVKGCGCVAGWVVA